MNILYINHYAGSPKHGMEYRPYYLSKEWAKQGHNITIMAASFSHLRIQNPKIRNRFFKEIINGINYCWVKTNKYKGNGIGRALNIFCFVWKLIINSRKIAGTIKPNVVIASSTYPLDIYPAYLIARLSRAKLIFEVHDLWPLTLIFLGGMSKWHPFVVMLQMAEDFAYKKCDKVISILPKTLDYMKSRGLSPNKFVHIPNGIDIEDWKTQKSMLPEEHHNIIERYQKEGKFLVGYSGYHGIANALDSFIESAKHIKNFPIILILVGDGPEKKKLMEYTFKNKLNNIIFLPPLNKEYIPSLLDKIDILYLGLRKNKLYKYGISINKLFDYMMAGKPIIFAGQAENDIVSECGCGLACSPEDPIAIADCIKKLYMMSPSDRAVMGEKGKNYVINNNDYKILAKKYLESIL
ncbi:MAG: glycosyltransferase family 4 protein [Candidatus Saccharicenans sp.]